MRAIGKARAAAAIDDPANLADDRVWLFSGTRDAIVPAGTAAALAALYRRLGVVGGRLAVLDDVPAAHGLPVESFEGDSRFPTRGCGEHAPPYVIDCGKIGRAACRERVCQDVSLSVGDG